MRTVQAAEAEIRLAELLREVEGGESVAITRDGRAVAHLVPVSAPSRSPLTSAEREAAQAGLRRLRATVDFAPMTRDEILAARHGGHRW
ncbi:MAG: type II toxin-antitoxin system prevent-host-death family antitoxin [Chloroflexota bacterium]|nr:type II toxin-antitoxin system prevent-host-death family antitoxin [Chloroflexota bacterium]MDE2884273.1 type II toxin-antitoxin system prevent-host-death family antitoxin [Chloroflexota bacterium]